MSKIVFVLVILAGFGLAHCAPEPDGKGKSGKIENEENAAQTDMQEGIVVEVFENNGTFGYNVLMRGKVLIHQATVPTQNGLTGFSTREKALKTGNFVAEKMKYGIIPPSVTAGELDSLGVLD